MTCMECKLSIQLTSCDSFDCYRVVAKKQKSMQALIRKMKSKFRSFNDEGFKAEEVPIEESTIKKGTNLVVAETNPIKKFCNDTYGFIEKGQYVRIDIKEISKEQLELLSEDYPIILATVDSAQSDMGYIRARFTKHLWHPKILKSKDPLVFSIGWRKFQSVPVFCSQDNHKRYRLIKYSHKYNTTDVIFYGPFMPINSPIVAFQNYDNISRHFRIAGTGDLIENNHSFSLVKKLKLIGEPYEIYKKTAFIKNMFTSSVFY